MIRWLGAPGFGGHKSAIGLAHDWHSTKKNSRTSLEPTGSEPHEDVAPIRRHDPGHPLADENGDVWEAPVDENAEMVEMLEASRQYRNMVEAMSTAKQLMLETMRMK